MPFKLHWVRKCFGKEDRLELQTPAGRFAIYSCQGVITRTDWLLSSDQPTDVHELDCYWQNPDQWIEITVLCQGTAFRNRVWSALSDIPFGETITYAHLAARIGSSARAVGGACRDNPYAVFIPCHRVISASGIGGYCGQIDGSLIAIKEKLLNFEANYHDEFNVD